MDNPSATAQSRYKRTASLRTSASYMNSTLSYYVEKQDLSGGFGFVEWYGRPGNEPPPHLHDHEDVFFYILDGVVDFSVGEEDFTVRAGECAILPRHKAHAYIIRSSHVRTLMMFSPGGFEGYFRKLGSPAKSMELPDSAITYATTELEDAVRVGAEFGIYFLSPPEIATQLPGFPGLPLPIAAFQEIPQKYKAL